jgi:hypothetical protein
MTADRARLHQYLRVAALLQVGGMLATIGLTVPDFIDYQTRALECGWCFDFRGAPFALSLTFLGPVILVLLLVAWRWRGPRLWPLTIVALIDALAIVWSVGVIIPLVFTRSDIVPPAASAAPLLLLPAIATLALGAALLRSVPWAKILAASAVVSLLPVACQGLGLIGPVHQSTPGELSLPFSRTTVYEGLDLGCVDRVQGWVDKHTCLKSTLLIYRGTGEMSKDVTTIHQALAARGQNVSFGGPVSGLPQDGGISPSYSRDVDTSNAGACLIITDRVSAPPSNTSVGRCAMVTDYADIRTHWPANDSYAIGIIYYWERRDYRDQYSVTFSHMPVGIAPGGSAPIDVHARPNTSCSIVVFDSSGQSNAPGFDPKTTDAAGDVAWTLFVDKSAMAGQWPIKVTCGASSGWSSWYVYRPAT